MNQEINIERCAKWLYNKYAFRDRIIEHSDIYSLVQYFVSVKGYTQLEFIRRRVYSELKKHYNLRFWDFFVDQEILIEKSINYDDYLIIDAKEIEWDLTFYKLGHICNRNHEFMDTGKTIRYRSNNGCLACIHENQKTSDREKNQSIILDYINVNNELEESIDNLIDIKYKLGKLCRHNHNYKNTGMSIRYLNGSSRCVECHRKVQRKVNKRKMHK